MNCRDARERISTALMTRTRVDEDALAHLSGCATCAVQAGELQEVAALLGDLEPLDAPPIAADELVVERLLREAGRRRTAGRRRLAVGFGVAGGACLLALGVGVAVTQPWRGALESAASATGDGITVSVEVEEEDGASDLAVAVSGVQMGMHCVLRVTSIDGQDEVVADWIALYEGTSHVEADADAAPEELTSLQLVDADHDRVLVTVPLA